MGPFGLLLNGVDDLLLALPLIGAYIMFALGIVVIFRASRVLNLAHGAMATLPAYVYYQLSTVWHWPAWPALAIAVGAGALTGLVVERAFVRPLRNISPTAQTVGTVAAFGLIVALVAKVWGTLAVRSVPLFGHGYVVVAGADLTAGKIGLFAVGLVVAAVFYAFFKFTRIGLAMRGAADNRRAAALMGVDPERTTAVAWALGGGTAALAGILLGAATSMEPYTLSLQALPGFVTVLIGGMESLLGALWGGAIVGAAIGLVPIVPGLGSQQGAPQLMLMVLAFVVMAARGARFSTSDVRGDALGGAEEVAAAPVRRARPLRKDLAALGVALALALPHLPGVTPNLVGDANTALEYGVVALSLVLLIGLVGQISLAQASFVGIGAFVTGVLISRYHIPFPAGMPIAALIGGVAAAALGLVALRVRGLYLAVATLIFAWMCDSYLFQQDWLVGVGGSTSFELPSLGVSPGYPFFDFSNRTTFYYAALATGGIIAMAVWLLRRSKTGRAFFAIRGSEMAAASLGIDVVRYKLLAFAVAGVVASAAGSLFAADARAITPAEFNVTVSLFYLSIAVVGGLTSIGGAVAAAVLFAALKEVFFQVDALNGYLDVVSSGLLIAVLLAYPGGLAAVPRTVSKTLDRLGIRPLLAEAERMAGVAGARLDGLYAQLRRGKAPATSASRIRLAELLASNGHSPEGEVVAVNGSASPSSVERLAASAAPLRLPASRDARKVLLAGRRLTMRFGGLVAVNDVSLDVREGEVVGLIGPNGAGKTTCFNCISGLLVPTSGRVELFGRDVTRRPVHERAALGLGRTFQVIQLFPQLNVFENLLVATHSSNPTGVLGHLAVTKRSLVAEREARAWVWEVIRLLDLEEVAYRSVNGLPFGQLRIVEVARALVTGARLLMLDEPASGLDNAETDRLTDLLLTLRSLLGLTILIIEHDVRMVTSVSDYMYVLDRGRLLAEGVPAAVQQDPEVIAAYLGRPASDPGAGAVLTRAET